VLSEVGSRFADTIKFYFKEHCGRAGKHCTEKRSAGNEDEFDFLKANLMDLAGTVVISV
jgi:hypothetical protein